MKYLLGAIVAVSCLPFSAVAEVKPCEELKAEIHEKISGNGVKEFELIVVEKDAEAEEGWSEVGSCEGGSKKILYKRG